MKLTTCFAMFSMMALAIPACTNQADPAGGAATDDEVAVDEGVGGSGGSDGGGDKTEGAVGTAEQALSCQLNVIWHYTYSDSTGNYRWDVSANLDTGKWYVDEKLIGGGRKQYVLTPSWPFCPSDPTTVALKYGTTTLTGIHDCLPDGREEVHLQDKQRVLTKSIDPNTGNHVDFYCAPL